jgi:hypothetical protein
MLKKIGGNISGMVLVVYDPYNSVGIAPMKRVGQLRNRSLISG